jgi:hypothetical protein
VGSAGLAPVPEAGVLRAMGRPFSGPASYESTIGGGNERVGAIPATVASVVDDPSLTLSAPWPGQSGSFDAE